MSETPAPEQPAPAPGPDLSRFPDPAAPVALQFGPVAEDLQTQLGAAGYALAKARAEARHWRDLYGQALAAMGRGTP